MTKQEKLFYEIAKADGEKRYGSKCRHRAVWNGKCVTCKRKVKL